MYKSAFLGFFFAFAVLVFVACGSKTKQGVSGNSTAYSNYANERFGLDGYILKFNELANGAATLYGKEGATASGERYDASAFTAAHKSLPFNTIVRVSNVQNGRTSFVRINDRIDTQSKSVLLVTQAVANELQMAQNETLVELEIIAYALSPNPTQSGEFGVSANDLNSSLARGGELGGANDLNSTLANNNASNALNSTPKSKDDLASAVPQKNAPQKITQSKSKSKPLHTRTFTEDIAINVSPPADFKASSGILVQIGAYKDLKNARELEQRYKSYLHYESFISTSKKGLHKVFLRGFKSVDEAKEFIKKSPIWDNFVVLDDKVIAYSNRKRPNSAKNALNSSLKKASTKVQKANAEYFVQIGTYRHNQNAYQALKDYHFYKGYTAFSKQDKSGLIRVLLQGFKTYEEALSVAQGIRNATVVSH